MSSGVSFTSCGEGASLALVGHPSSDVVKMPYGVDVLHRPAESGFIVRSVETGLGR